MKNNINIEAEGSELILQNTNGDHVIVPKKLRSKVKYLIEHDHHNAVTNMVNQLPRMKDYAEDGTIIPATEATNPDPIEDEVYFKIGGKLYSYTNLKKKGWTDDKLNKFEAYKQGELGYQKIKEAAAEKPVEQKKKEFTKEDLTADVINKSKSLAAEKNAEVKPANTEQLAQPAIEEQKKNQAQEITEGNFTYIRNPETGKVYVKHKDAKSFQDLDEKRKTNPDMVPVIDKIEGQFNSQFGTVNPWDRKVNLAMSQNEEVYSAWTAKFDEEIKMLEEDYSKRSVIAVTKPKNLSEEELAENGKALAATQKRLNDMRVYKSRIEQSYKQPKELYDIAKKTIADHGKRVHKDYTKDPVQGMNDVMRYRAPVLVNYLPEEGQEQFKLVLKLQDLNEQSTRVEKDIEFARANPPETGKNTSAEKLEEKLQDLSDKKNKMRYEIEAYKKSYTDELDKKIDILNKQKDQEQDPEKKMELANKIRKYSGLKTSVFIDPKDQIENLTSQFESELVKFADIIPDATPREALNFYFQTLVTQEQQLMDDLKIGQSALRDNFINLASNFKNNAKLEELYGPDGVSAKIAVLAPVLLLNELPEEYLTGNKVDPNQGWMKKTADKAFSREYPLGNIALKVAQTYSPHLQAASKTVSQQAQTLQSTLQESGLDKFMNEAFTAEVSNKADVKHWSTEDVGNMVGPTLGIMIPMAAGNVAFGAVKAFVPMANMVRGVKLANQVSKASKLTKGAKVLGATMAETGIEYKMGGLIFSGNDQINSEADFVSGAAGAVGTAAVEAIPMPVILKKVFGKSARKFLNTVTKPVEAGVKASARGTSQVIGKGAGETGEEFIQSTWQMYRDAENKSEFKEQFEAQFGTADESLHFFAQTFLMGMSFGTAGTIGKAYQEKIKEARGKVSSQKKADAAANFVVDFLANNKASQISKDPEKYDDGTLATSLKFFNDQEKEGKLDKNPAAKGFRNKIRAEMSRRGVGEMEATALAKAKELEYIAQALDASKDKKLAKEMHSESEKHNKIITEFKEIRQKALPETEVDSRINAIQKSSGIVTDLSKKLNQDAVTVLGDIEKGKPIEKSKLSSTFDDLVKNYRGLQALRSNPNRENTTQQIEQVQAVISEGLTALVNKFQSQSTFDDKKELDRISMLANNVALHIKKTQDARQTEKKADAQSKGQRTKGPGRESGSVRQDDGAAELVPEAQEEKTGNVQKEGEPVAEEASVIQEPTEIEKAKEEYVSQKKIRDEKNKQIRDLQQQIEIDENNLSQVSGLKDKDNLAGAKIISERIAKAKKEVKQLELDLPDLSLAGKSVREKSIANAKKQGYVHVDTGTDTESHRLKGAGTKNARNQDIVDARKEVKEGDVIDINFKERKDFTKEELKYTNTTNAQDGYEHMISAEVNGKRLGGIPYKSDTDNAIRQAIKAGKNPKLVVTSTAHGAIEFEVITDKDPGQKAAEKIAEEVATRTGVDPETYKEKLGKSFEDIQQNLNNFGEHLKGMFDYKNPNNQNLGIIPDNLRDDIMVDLIKIARIIVIDIPKITGQELIKMMGELMVDKGYNRFLKYLDMFAETIINTVGVVNDLNKAYNKYKGEFSAEAFYTSSDEKIRAMRKVFRKMFDVMLDQDILEPEREIFNLSQDKAFLESFKSENDVYYYITNNIRPTNPRLAETLLDDNIITYNQLISLKNLYSNLRLIPSLSIHQVGNSFSILNMNQNDRTHDWAKLIKNHLETFTYEDIRTDNAEALKKITNDYVGVGNKNSREQVIKNKYRGDEKALQGELISLYSEYLSKVTSIHENIWRHYFTVSNERDFMNGTSSRTNGTAAIIYYFQEGNNKYTRNGKGNYIRDAIAYFVNANNEKADSNLVKLVNSTMDSQHVALSFNNVKGDKKTSFEQTSDLLMSARNVAKKLKHAFYKDNPILKHHEQAGEIPIMKLDGMSNASTNNNVLSNDLSDNDYMLSTLILFSKGDKAYRHSIGQFGDKDQIYLIEAPKYAKAGMTYRELLKKYEGNEKLSGMMATEKELLAAAEDLIAIINANPFAFSADVIENTRNFARNFIFNYAINKHYSDLIFHGKIDQYKSFTDMVKRAGSTNSPGYVPDIHIEGGIGKTQKHLILNDPVSKEIQKRLKLDKPFEMMDGIQFMTREFADKLEVSMGSVFARVEEFSRLNSVKPLYSVVHPNGVRGLTKTNLVVIDEFAAACPGSIFDKINQLMISTGADTVSFLSGTKYADGPVNKVFVDDKFVMPETAPVTFERNNENFFIQQDLRHDVVPEFKKQPIQSIGNFANLSIAQQVAELWNKIQEKTLEKVMAEMGSMDDQTLREALIAEIDQEQLPELYQYVKNGGNIRTPNPYFDGLLTSIRASYIGRKVLERKVNRVALQEIPAADVHLSPPRKTADEKHVHLAEWAGNIKGTRYMSDSPSFTNLAEAITFIREKGYVDLMHEENGKLIVNAWEIIEENGMFYIPGEPVLITRVPADDLHSHTIARAKIKIRGAGNVIMTDAESQSIAGSDNDGDKRFVETFIKNKEGKIVNTEDSINGMINQTMLLLLDEYRNPANFDRIREQINKEKYNRIVDKVKKGKTYKHNNFMDNVSTRKENVVGAKVIGITAKMSTTFDFIKRLDLSIKHRKRNNSFRAGRIVINQFTRDPYSLFKHHIGNLLNLALDNAKDPKIEFLGYNEVTSGMFIAALIGNNGLDHLSKTEQEKAIIDRVEQISDYFNSGIGQEFIRLERMRRRVESLSTVKDTFIALERVFGRNDTYELKQLYYFSKDVQQLTTFIDIAREVPENAEEFGKVDEAYHKIKNNDLKNLDVSNVFPDGEISIFLKSAEVSFEQATNLVYNNSIEWSPFFKKIKGQVINTESTVSDDDLDFNQKTSAPVREDEYVTAFHKFFRKLYTVLGMDNGKTITQLYDSITKAIQSNTDNNQFLALLQSRTDSKTGSKRIEILSNYKKSDISLTDLATIHADFNKLPAELKQSLVLYSLHEYGVSISSWSGNYSKLFPVEFMVEMDNIMKPLTDLILTGNSSDQNRYTNIFKYELKKLFGKEKYAWNRHIFDVNLKTILAEKLLKAITDAQAKKMSQSDIMDIVNRMVNIPISDAFPKGRPDIRQAYDELVALAGNKDFVEFLTEVVNRKNNLKSEVEKPVENTKTERGNVKVLPIFGQKGLDYEAMKNKAKEMGGIYSLRMSGNKHFGNPFGSNKNATGLVQLMGTVAESVQAYRDWLMTDKYDGQFGPVLDERKKWILEQINSGKLKGKPIIYWKELDETSHANVLDELINEREKPKQMQLSIFPSIQFIRDEFSLDRWITENGKPRKVKKAYQNDSVIQEIIDQIEAKYPDLIVYPLQMHNGQAIQIERDLTKPRQHSSRSPLGELYAYANTALQDYIVSHFAKMFPQIQVFRDRAAFEKFVIDSFGSLEDMDLNTIGATFHNAIFIDPERAVQSTFFHEVGHIYWGLLPDSNPVKKKLTKLFGNEEDAVIMIGQAGTGYAKMMMDGSKWEKFTDLLKQFWADVKALIGARSKKDVAMQMARMIWNNSESLATTEDGLNAIKFMIDPVTGVDFNEKDHKYTAPDGKSILLSVTQLVSSLQRIGFSPERAANQAIRKEIRERADAGEPVWSKEDVDKRRTELINKWAMSSHYGTVLHTTAQMIRSGQDIPDEVERMFAPGVLDQFRRDTQDHFRKELNPNGDPEREEELIASVDDYLAGHVDKQIDTPDGIVVIDFKTSDKRRWDGDTLSEDYTSAYNNRRYINPFSAIKDSIINHHKIQINLYCRMLARTGKQVKNGYVQPIYYELNADGKISLIEYEKPISTDYKKYVTATDQIINFNRVRQEQLQGDFEFDEAPRAEGYSIVAIENQRKALANLQSMLMPGENLATLTEDAASRMLGRGAFLIKEHLVDELGFSPEEVARMDLFTALNHFIHNEYRPEGITNEYSKSLPENDPANKILDEIGTLDDLVNLEVADIKRYESKTRDYNSDVGRLIHSYFVKQMVKHMLIDEVRKENRPGNKQYKLATVLLNEFVTDTATATKDLYKSVSLMRFVMNDRLIPDNFKAIQLLQTMIRERGDAVDRKTIDMIHIFGKIAKGVNIGKLVTIGLDGMPYLMYPETANKKFGPDSKEARYVKFVYAYYAEYNPAHRKIANDPNPANRDNVPQIVMPTANISKTKALLRDGFRGLKLRKLLKPEPWDYQFINRNAGKFKDDTTIGEDGEIIINQGEPEPLDPDLIQFVEYKKHFDLENGDMKELEKFYDIAKHKYQGSSTSEREYTRRRIAIKHNTKDTYIKLYNHHHNAVMMDHLSSMIKKSIMEDVIPFFDFIDADLYGRTNEFDKGNPDFKHLRSYIDKFVKKRLFNKSEDIGWVEKGATFIMTLTALKSLSFNLTAQIVNLAIGQINNIVLLGPLRYAKGVAWIAQHPLATNRILHDMKFIDIQHEHGFEYWSSIGRKIVGFTFILTDVAETLNHGIALGGIAKRSELNTLRRADLKERVPINDQRRRIIEDSIRKIHGDYGEKNAAIATYATWGRVLFQFRRWLPAFYLTQFGPGFIDRNGILQRGYFGSGLINFQRIIYNMQSEATRKQIYEEYKAEGGKENPTKFNLMSDSDLVAMGRVYKRYAEAGKISFKDMDPSDQANVKAFFRQVGLMAAVMALLIADHYDDDDDDKEGLLGMDKALWKFIKETIVLRLAGDVLFFFSWDTWDYLFKGPIPAMAYMLDLSNAIQLTGLYLRGELGDDKAYMDARYAKDTPPYGKAGDVKALNRLLRVAPAGSMMYQTKKFLSVINEVEEPEDDSLPKWMKEEEEDDTSERFKRIKEEEKEKKAEKKELEGKKSSKFNGLKDANPGEKFNKNPFKN